MDTPIMILISRHLRTGEVLKTPSGRASFKIYHIDPSKVTVHVGSKPHSIKIPAQCFEDVPNFLKRRGWVKIGATHQNTSEDTFDNFVKKYTYGTSAASYVVPILERCKVIRVDRKRPAKIQMVQ